MCRKKKYVHIYLFFICDKTSEVDFYVVQSLVMKIVSGRCSHLDLFSKISRGNMSNYAYAYKKVNNIWRAEKAIEFHLHRIFQGIKKKKKIKCLKSLNLLFSCDSSSWLDWSSTKELPIFRTSKNHLMLHCFQCLFFTSDNNRGNRKKLQERKKREKRNYNFTKEEMKHYQEECLPY